MKEIWKDIPEYEGLYQVSNLGRIKSLPRNTAHERILKLKYDKYGYNYVNLSKNGVAKSKKIHILVAEAFIPNPENKPQVNHIDGIKNNNVVSNLEWCTRNYNIKHAYKLGLIHHWMKGKKGKDCPFSKKVNQYDLKGNFIKTWDSMSDINRELAIPVSNLSRACKGQRKSCFRYIWRYYDERG